MPQEQEIIPVEMPAKSKLPIDYEPRIDPLTPLDGVVKIITARLEESLLSFNPKEKLAFKKYLYAKAEGTPALSFEYMIIKALWDGMGFENEHLPSAAIGVRRGT